MFGRWLPAACLLVACGSPKSGVAPQDTSGADVQNVEDAFGRISPVEAVPS